MPRRVNKTILNLIAAFCWASGSAALMYDGYTLQSPGLFVTGICGASLLLCHFFTEALD